MNKRVFKHFHFCRGLSGGAKGFNRARPVVSNMLGTWYCIGGVDVDPVACATSSALLARAAPAHKGHRFLGAIFFRNTEIAFFAANPLDIFDSKLSFLNKKNIVNRLLPKPSIDVHSIAITHAPPFQRSL